MPHDLTSLQTAMEAAVTVLEKYQIEPTAFFIDAGFDPKTWTDPDARVKYEPIKKFWRKAVQATGSPCIGFEVGMRASPAHFHAVGYSWLASRTVREALERLVRFQMIVTTAHKIVLSEDESTVSLTMETHPKWPPEGTDALFSAVMSITRAITYEDFAPIEVTMRRERPPCQPMLSNYFLCPIVYGADENRISFRREQISKFLPRQNPAMAQAADDIAGQYIRAMDQADVLTRARIMLVSMLPDGVPSRPELSNRLHMSDRTLARRLRDQGTSFREMLDDVRRELGIGYMRQPRHSIMEITYLLGFSDQSNFARWFRKWSGKSPTEFRADLLNEAADEVAAARELA